LRSPTVTPKLQRIAAQAACDPARVFTTLAHLIDVDFLREAYDRTRKSSAPGIDGVTAKEYAEHLDENLHDLHERLRSGRYQAPPVERVWLDKVLEVLQAEGLRLSRRDRCGAVVWQRPPSAAILTIVTHPA
jgi:hypothetical protein